MKMRAQWLALLALGGVWAVLLLWNFLFMAKPERVPLKYVSGQTASRESGRGPAITVVKIRMDLLEAERRQAEVAFATPKNIFAPLRHEGSEGTIVKVRHMPVLPPPQPVAPAPPPAPTPEELAAQAAQSELAQFRYLGFLSRNGQDEAFLSKGKELRIVRTGGMIEERVLVKAITPKDVTLQETKSQVEKTVLLASEGR
jgi:hypothetical protein